MTSSGVVLPYVIRGGLRGGGVPLGLMASPLLAVLYFGFRATLGSAAGRERTQKYNT